MKKILFTLLIFTLFSTPAFLVQAAAPTRLLPTGQEGGQVRILIVPGHDNETWGAQYGNIKEADMTLALGTQLFDILKKDKRFEVHITRDTLGYTTEFADYFGFHQADISAFRKASKIAMQNEIQDGSFVKKVDNVDHNTVSEEVAMDLYGINKWADENKMDAVIHIHFNDYPRKTKWTKGIYKGFTIYMPEAQMVNSKDSVSLAKSVFTQLRKKYTPSTYPKELGGLVPEQSLIALGSNGTLLSSVRSILVEYGYIYRFGNSTFRHQFYTSMANLTATGIKNYFFKK